MSEKTLFTKIIEGEIPSVFVHDDEFCVVIMDKFPTTKGKCLVIPKEPVDYAFDLDSDVYLHCQAVAYHVAKAIDASLKPVRTCMVIEGFEVPHAHIKLCPCYEKSLSMEAGEMADDVDLEAVAVLIRAQLVD